MSRTRDLDSSQRAVVALPEKIGPYRVLQRLGAGGMGEVFLAERVGAGGFRRRCCVKTVLPQLSGRQELLELFEREAVLAARVSHENVVQVFDYGQDGETLYLAMEYVDGVSARALSRLAEQAGQGMTVAEAGAITVDVARGLAAVHGLVADDGAPVGLVHRDVTPDNVMVTRDGLAKLGDFGVARATDSQPMTQTGALRGKLPYMAPEQVDALPITQAADMWSLGVTLFQLLVGRRPFDRGTELGTMNAIVGEAAPDLRVVRPDVPEALAELVEALLDKEPNRRPSAREVIDRLLTGVPGAAARPTALVTRALAQLPAPAPSAPAPAKVTLDHADDRTESAEAAPARPKKIARPSRARAPLLGGLAAVTVAAGVLGAFELGRDRAERAQPIVIIPSDKRGPEAAPTEGPPAVAVGERPPTETPPLEVSNPDEPSAATPALPLVHLIAPDTVKWSVGRKSVGAGTADVRTSARSLTAIDSVTGGRSTVAIVKGRADYGALGAGTLEVRAEPYADVFIGSRALGTTPLKPKPVLPAGEYVVMLRHEGKQKVERITISAGKTAVVRANMTADTPGGAP